MVANQLTLNRDIILDYAGGPNGITRVLGRGRQKNQRSRGNCDDRSEVRVTGCEKGPPTIAALKTEEGGQELRKPGSLWNLKRQGNGSSPRASKKNQLC